MDKLSTFSISNLKEGGDLTPFFQDLKDPIPEFNSLYKPSPPTTLDEVDQDENAGNDDDSIDSAELALERDIYKEEVKAFVARRNLLKRNMRKLFGLIWGQCSSALQAKVKGISCYTGMAKKLETITLATEIKKIVSGINSKDSPRVNMYETTASFYNKARSH